MAIMPSLKKPIFKDSDSKNATSSLKQPVFKDSDRFLRFARNDTEALKLEMTIGET